MSSSDGSDGRLNEKRLEAHRRIADRLESCCRRDVLRNLVHCSRTDSVQMRSGNWMGSCCWTQCTHMEKTA